MSDFIENPASKMSLGKRKPLCGVGINDATYITGYTANGKQVMCPYYACWRSMLGRCYDPKIQAQSPTYIGCSVCSDWLTFSKFKSWMETQNWKGMALDKDIICPGNKVYSPDTCCFIPQSINSLLNDSKAIRGIYPIGVSWDKVHKKFKAQCRVNGKNKYLGYFNTIEAASEVYKTFKYHIIRKVAETITDINIKYGLLLHADRLINQPNLG